MSLYTRALSVVGTLATGAGGAVLVYVSITIEAEPIIQCLTMGVGVLLFGCASAIAAGTREDA
jgi:hypothetical protein